MLTEEHFDMFRQFRIKAMGDKLREMVDDHTWDNHTFEERMQILIETEAQARHSRKLDKLVRQARFKTPTACIEDIIYLPERVLSKDRINRYAQCEWITAAQNIVIIAKTRAGKSYLAQALGNAACRHLIPVRYTRLAGICEDLNRARAQGGTTYWETMDTYKTIDLLIIDDFMTTPITTQNSVDLFEITEARESRRATLIASQLAPEQRYLRIEGELMADSISNRITTTARYIDLDGPNMREYLTHNN